MNIIRNIFSDSMRRAIQTKKSFNLNFYLNFNLYNVIKQLKFIHLFDFI